MEPWDTHTQEVIAGPFHFWLGVHRKIKGVPFPVCLSTSCKKSLLKSLMPIVQIWKLQEEFVEKFNAYCPNMEAARRVC